MNTTKDIHENGEDRKLKETFGTSMPYEVPDGYFEQLPEQLLSSVKQSPRRSVIAQRGFRTFAAAAAILIFAALASTFIFTDRNSVGEGFENYSMSDIYHYNINNLADLEEAYLYSLIDDDSSGIMNLMLNDTDSVSDDYIMDYLLAENHIEYYIINEY